MGLWECNVKFISSVFLWFQFFRVSHKVEVLCGIFEQMVLLSPLSQNSKEFQTEENNTRGRRRNIIIQGIDVDYTWVLILFDRGFNHKNLQGEKAETSWLGGLARWCFACFCKQCPFMLFVVQDSFEVCSVVCCSTTISVAVISRAGLGQCFWNTCMCFWRIHARITVNSIGWSYPSSGLW